jgi:hypothetical protein
VCLVAPNVTGRPLSVNNVALLRGQSDGVAEQKEPTEGPSGPVRGVSASGDPFPSRCGVGFRANQLEGRRAQAERSRRYNEQVVRRGPPVPEDGQGPPLRAQGAEPDGGSEQRLEAEGLGPSPGPSRAERRKTEVERRRARWRAAKRRDSRLDPAFIAALPKYVRCCWRNPDLEHPFWVWIWEKANPQKATRRPYLCNSWRCRWGCERHQAHTLYARIREAFEGVPAEETLLVVLTMPSLDHEARGLALDEVYRGISHRHRWLNRMWKRRLQKLGLPDFGNRWVATVEAHASGVPHLNVYMHSPELAKIAREQRAAALEAGASIQRKEDIRIQASPWLRCVTRAGFGVLATWTVSSNVERMIGYMVKGAARFEETNLELRARTSGERVAGEVAKPSQLPLNAPKGLRRVRSGKGFLPPKHKDETITGTILRRKITPQGDEIVLPLVKSQDPDYMRIVDLVCDLEQRIAWDDEGKRAKAAWCRRMGVPAPKEPEVTVHLLALARETGPPHAQGPPEETACAAE